MPRVRRHPPRPEPALRGGATSSSSVISTVARATAPGLTHRITVRGLRHRPWHHLDRPGQRTTVQQHTLRVTSSRPTPPGLTLGAVV